VKHILPQLLKYGRVIRGYLGLHAQSAPLPSRLAREFALTQKTGVEIQAVEDFSPAAEAGLDEGDLILSLGEQPVTSVDDLHKLLTSLPVGVPASIIFVRNERRIERLVMPKEWPNPWAK